MEIMVPVIKRGNKKPVLAKKVEKPDKNFDTYIQMVEKKAYELYEKRGCQQGRDREDWIEAEKLVEDELCK